MNNEFLLKLLNKIDIELVKQFDRNKLIELHFVPVFAKENSVFIAISQDSNKEAVMECVRGVISNLNPEPISMPSTGFAYVLSRAMRMLKSLDENKQEQNPEQSPVENPQQEENKEQNDAKGQENPSNEGVEASVSDNSPQAENSSNEEQVDGDSIVSENENQQQTEPDDIKPGEIEKVKSPQKKRIGEILVEEKLLTEKQVEEALVQSKTMGLPLGSTLVKLGYITIKQLRDALAAQMQIGVATEEQLASLPDSTACLSDDFVKEHKVIPLIFSAKSLTVGMVNPKDTDTINQIIGMTGLKPTVLMVTSLEYERYIAQYYNKKKDETRKLAFEKKKKSSLEALNEDIIARGTESSSERSLWEQVQRDIEDISSDAATYAHTIVTQAIDSRASDIHIEPRLDGYVTRFRIDGTLVEVVKIPASLESQIVSRFKVLAKMNIAEHRRPQDGNFTIKYHEQSYDFRINTLPVNGREKIVIRILAPSMRAEASYTKNIDIVGAFPDDIEKIKYLISAPNGIVLTSGPTGSGKTTTLYALLKTMNSPDTNITTIEDPVEIRLDGVNQSAVNPKAGITFASCMRAILRQDPDVILVGEIRDFETLEVAISASLTGHFVLSTIHTNSASATVTRLIEMGAKDYLVSSTLNGVLAQRLVKRLCPECKKAYQPTEEEARKITVDPERIKQIQNMTLYKPTGCPNCDGTGYKGRLAILEILVITKEIKKLIAAHAHDIEIEEHAVQNGMRTLKESCIKHILEGNTTIDEFVRVLGLVGE